MPGSIALRALLATGLVFPLAGRGELASLDVRIGPVTLEAPRQVGGLKVDEVVSRVEYLDPGQMKFGESSIERTEAIIEFREGGSIQIEIRPNKDCSPVSQVDEEGLAIDSTVCVDQEWSGLLQVELRARFAKSCRKDALDYLEELQLHLDGDSGKPIPISFN